MKNNHGSSIFPISILKNNIEITFLSKSKTIRVDHIKNEINVDLYKDKVYSREITCDTFDYSMFDYQMHESYTIFEFLTVCHIIENDFKINKFRIIFQDLKVTTYYWNTGSLSWTESKDNPVEMLRTEKHKIAIPNDKFLLYEHLKNEFENKTKFKLNNGVNYLPNFNVLEFVIIFYSLYKNPAISLIFNFFKDEIQELCMSGFFSEHTYRYYLIKTYKQSDFSRFNFLATNLRDFLNVNKTIFKWIKSKNLSLNTIISLNNNDNIEWGICVELYSKIQTFDLVHLYNNLTIAKYKELFIAFYRNLVKSNIGISKGTYYDIMRDYIDYLNFCYRLNIQPKKGFTLNNFYKEYDKLILYKTYRDYDSNSKFTYKNSQLNLKYSLEFDGYLFIFPTDPSELDREGYLQRHCVGSYYNDIVNGRCEIVFMRKLSNINEPYLTIQLSSFNNISRKIEVLQVRGFSNRSSSEYENVVINKWINHIINLDK